MKDHGVNFEIKELQQHFFCKASLNCYVFRNCEILLKKFVHKLTISKYLMTRRSFNFI